MWDLDTGRFGSASFTIFFFSPSVPLEWIKTESNPYKIFGTIYMIECVEVQVNTYSKLRVEIPRDTPEANLVKKT